MLEFHTKLLLHMFYTEVLPVQKTKQTPILLLRIVRSNSQQRFSK